jgi:hypothetical protein
VDPAVQLFVRHGLVDGAALATFARTAGASLHLQGADDAAEADASPARLRFSQPTLQLASQRTVSAALALAPAAVWPVCFELLRALLDPTPLLALHENDVRIFRTPRGRLMIEEFRSSLSPDELIAQRSAPPPRRRNGGAAAAPDAKAKKKPALSKEEQLRVDMLEAEVCVHTRAVQACGCAPARGAGDNRKAACRRTSECMCARCGSSCRWAVG